MVPFGLAVHDQVAGLLLERQTPRGDLTVQIGNEGRDERNQGRSGPMTVFLDGGASRARQAFRLAEKSRPTVAGQRRTWTGFPWTSNAVIYL